MSKGGLAIALAECCVSAGLHGEKNTGAYIELQSDIRIDSLLFGESQSRIIITTSKKDLNLMKKIAAQNKVILTEIGKTGGDRLIINIDWAAKKCSQKINIKISELENIWMNGVNKYV